MRKQQIFFKYTVIVLAVMILVVAGVFFKMVTSNNNSSDVVLLHTSMGDIKIKLDFKNSPIASENFRKLVKENFYDGIKFHRVIKNFMIQAGDPLTRNDSLKNRWGTGGPGYTIADEFKNGLLNTKGTIAMANKGTPHSSGSQFYINTVDNKYLNGKYTVFGKVISGMDVVEKIDDVKTDSSDRPITDVTIIKASMVNN